MAQSSWPSPGHNSRAVTDLEYEKLAARFSDNGVYGTPLDDAVVTAGAGLSVSVRAGVYGSVRGHAWSSGTSTVTLSIAANSSGSTRVDRVVLRLDRSDWTVRAVVKQGTPGAGVPTLTQQTGDTGVYEVLLANVTVLNGASSVTVVRGERYVGSRIRPTTTSALTDPNPMDFEARWYTDVSQLRMYDGGTERTVYSHSGVVVVDQTAPNWSIETSSVLEERSGVVCLRLGTFKRTGSSLASGTASRLPVQIPAAYRHPTRDQYAICYITGVEIGRAIIFSGGTDTPGQVQLVQKPTMAVGDNVFPMSGLSWVVN
ncbi:hypothetical protein ACQEV9_18335 [Streptomyces chartreusis]|uniref:hypothetical protein n=1 Tax=Streptomyces TaxID=1883 RepID=UPI00362C0670